MKLYEDVRFKRTLVVDMFRVVFVICLDGEAGIGTNGNCNKKDAQCGK